MFITINVPNLLGTGETILRAMHSLSAIPPRMGKNEAGARMALAASDLLEAGQALRKAADSLLDEQPPRRTGRRGPR